ncbi:hypothetical protein AgCh_039241 [Apium graveolens]
MAAGIKRLMAAGIKRLMAADIKQLMAAAVPKRMRTDTTIDLSQKAEKGYDCFWRKDLITLLTLGVETKTVWGWE